MSKTLDLEQAAALLKISTDGLSRKARAGQVPGTKIGRRWVFVEEDLIALIRGQAQLRGSFRSAVLSAPMLQRAGNSETDVHKKLDARLARLRTGN